MKDVIEELSKRYIDTPVWEVEKYLSTEPFPYEEEVIDRLVEILQGKTKEKIDRSWLDDMNIKKLDDNTVTIRTPSFTWERLYGREWTFDLKKGEYHLTSMN